jgi:anti-sigma factor RsiW
MSDCRTIDPMVTPYVDGELSAVDRGHVESHLQRCPTCHRRVEVERAVRSLMHDRRSSLVAPAPAGLRARCSSAARQPSRAVASFAWRATLLPFALAASLVLVVGGAFLYEVTAHSTHIMVAELTADHLKCFRVNGLIGTRQDATAVESAMASRFDWRMRLPDHPERADLELVGSRPCLYGEGLVGHIMYRHHGNPVSVFMLPKSTRAEELVEVMGHQASVWSVGNRTFVLISREPRDEVERMTSFVHAALR